MRALDALSSIVAVLIGLFAIGAPRCLLYNASPSAPVGFYVRIDRPARVGDWVTLPVPAAARDYAASREFGDRTDRFIKRIAAAAGETVCAQGDLVTLSGQTAIRRAMDDSAGQALPTWEGCRVLDQNEVFLLGRTDGSFDGRYWGVTRLDEIDGVWRPIRLQRREKSLTALRA